MSARDRERAPHLDRLIDRARGDDIDELHLLRRCPVHSIRYAVRWWCTCSGCWCPSPCETSDEVRMSLKSLDAAAGEEVPGANRLVVGS